jgi:NAD(P)-dependent dehydrogenase (short-subunit alcohol dehydrogenase family)
MGDLEGRSALITGAASGLGRAIAQRLASESANVTVADIAMDGASETAESIGGLAVQLDVTAPDSWEDVVALVTDQHGRLDALVNCAGVDAPDDNIDSCTTESWQRVMRVNLDGTFLGVTAAVQSMRSSGGGAIVNIASVLGVVADGHTLAYSASKAAVRALTRSVALEAASDGIRCNAILPGYIDTPMTRRWLEHDEDHGRALEELVGLHPIGRLGTADEIANLTHFLVSDDARFVTGSQFAIDGGYLAV